MAITARMRVSQLLEQHPDARDVFESYAIELDETSLDWTLDKLCREEAINYWDLKSDIALTEGWDGGTAGFGGEEGAEDAKDAEDDDEDWEDDGSDDDDWDGDDDEEVDEDAAEEDFGDDEDWD